MYKLPQLPYGYGDLAPIISREALEIHHHKHHGGYIEHLNGLLERTVSGATALEQLVRIAHGEVFDNAAQAWNHEFYWHCMSPLGGGEPSDSLGEAVTQNFGSFRRLKQEFELAGRRLLGSGWVWLVADGAGELAVRATYNADTPLRSSLHPILVCDVWEHAYYLDYRNRRADYLASFWDVVNWRFAVRQYFDLPRFAPPEAALLQRARA